MAVGAAGLELVAQGGLVHEHIYADGDDDGDDDAAVDLRAGQQLIQAHLGGSHAVFGGNHDVAGLAGLRGALQLGIGLKEHIHQVASDPVGHNAGEHFVYAPGSLQQAGDGAPDGTQRCACQESQNPNQPGGDYGGGDAQCHIQRTHSAHKELSRRADVEQARLESHGYGKAGHHNGHGTEEHIAPVGGVEAEGQLCVRATASGEQTAEDQANAVKNGLGGEALGIAGKAYDHSDDAAQHQAGENGDQRCQHFFRAVFPIQIQQRILHAYTSCSLSRLAPAM